LKGEFNILFLSRVEEAKGIFLALDTFAMLKEDYEGVGLTIVGDGSRSNDAKYYCKERLIKDVIFCGHLEGEEKYQMFCDASCYLLPTYGEGMPNALLEAMAFGLPIITRSVGGITDFFEDGRMGYVTNSLDPSDFAKLIGKLIKNPLLCEEMGRYNRDYSFRHFRASRAAEKLLSIYEMIACRQYISNT
jgi:glycosyltransferase involved in cell wall biosynthesis